MADDEGGEGPYRRLETIIENAPIVLFSIDADGTFVMSKGRGLEALGLQPGEVVGESVYDLYAGAEDVLDNVDRALEGEEFNGTVEVGDRVFDVWYQPTYEGDDFVRTTGVALDVTDRVKHEQRLERLNEASRQLSGAETPEEIAAVVVEIAEEVVEQPLTVVWAYDDEDERLRPLAATESAEVFEANGGELPGPVGPDTFEMDVFNGEESVHIEDYQTLDDPALPEVPLRTVLFLPLKPHGLLWVGFTETKEIDPSTRDIVEILARDAVAALDRADRERELARKNERLEEFARVVSHDLRNPLNLIHGHVTLARDAENILDHLDSIEGAVDRMNRLIENLLALAREGRIVGQSIPVELSSVASGAWDAVETVDADLEFDQEVRPIMADRDRLQQMLENLFRNAVEHGGESVTVTVGSLDGGFYIQDDGAGLPEGDPSQLFKIGHSSTDEGTGMGLAIVQEIANGHGWEIAATESPDGGARFEVTGVDVP